MDDDLPDDLRRRLAEAYPSPPVPKWVDDRVLRGARAHLLGRGRRRWYIGSAVAAAVAVAVTLPFALHSHDPRDLNGDGRFNILDVLAAANRGDGQQRVDQLASAAVRLGELQ